VLFAGLRILQAEIRNRNSDAVQARFGVGRSHFTFLEYQPDEAGEEIKANTVSIILGDETADDEEELGAAQGGLYSVEFPVFVDIYGANAPIAVSIASDVKAILGDLSLFVRDFTGDAEGVLTDEHIVVDRGTVSVERPSASLGSADLRKYWRVTKATATVYFRDGP
jgi:hypothetical protein